MPGILVEIVGNATQFKRELDSAVVATNKANTGFAKMSKAAGIAGLALAGGLAIGLDKSVKAAMSAETQTARLSEAFKASGSSLDAYKGAIDSAEAASRKLGFSNVDVRNALGSLVVATHSGKKAIDDLSVAEDIARFRHVDLATASKSLTMAMAGSQRAIKQLGLSVQASTDHMDKLKAAHKAAGTAITAYEKATATAADKQETSARVIELVRQKLAGQADAYSKTAAGGMAQFHAQTEALEENLGAGLLPALTAVAGGLATMAAFFAEHTTTAKVLVGALAALAGALLAISVATKAYAAGAAIIQGVTAAWTAAQWLLNAALDANPIGIVVVAIAALVAGLVLAYQHSETFRKIVQGALHAVQAAAEFLINFFSDHWKIIAVVFLAPFLPIIAAAYGLFKIKDALVAAANAIISFFRDHWKVIATLISGPFAPLVLLATDAFGVRSAIVNAFNVIKNAVTGVMDDIVGAFRYLQRNVGPIWNAIYKALMSPVNAAISLFQRLYDMIMAVKNAVASVIDAIGNIHIPHIPGIPGFASGGEIGAGQLAVVGERGPELFMSGTAGKIIPAGGSFGASRGSGMIVNVNVAGALVGSSVGEVAATVRDELLRMQRRGVGLGFA